MQNEGFSLRTVGNLWEGIWGTCLDKEGWELVYYWYYEIPTAVTKQDLRSVLEFRELYHTQKGQGGQDMAESQLEPIAQKIRFWVAYERNLPSLPHRGNEMIFDEYRSQNDLDCRLTGGSLNADTIFSLWYPLQYSLEVLHEADWLRERVGEIRKSEKFLQNMLNYGLEELFPPESELVQRLRDLFILGQGRENVMLLLNRGLNPMRAALPYEDYVPYFLRECFEGGAFAHMFGKNMEILRNWIQREELQMFFRDGFLLPEEIMDLSGTGDLTQGNPLYRGEERLEGEEAERAVMEMLARYVDVLLTRREALAASGLR